MKNSVLRKAIASVSVFLVATVTLSGNAVNALLINVANPNVVIDTFDSLSYGTDNSIQSQYWWVVLGNLFPAPNKTENVPCASGVNGDANCVTIESEGLFGLNKFARLAQRPQAPGQYSIAQLSDTRDGYSYHKEKRWLPKVGKPVISTSRVRFTGNYKDDASGSAIGTAGLILFNFHIEIVNQPPFVIVNPHNAIGFSWASADNTATGAIGYRAVVSDGTFPVAYSQPIDVNLNDWFTQTFIWSVNSQGVQKVDFFIGTQQVGSHTLTTPLPAQSIAIWVDCNTISLTPTGVVSSCPQITEDHFMDVDYISVVQP